MSEERGRILKMLEEGKITAEQAARLIAALGSQARENDGERVIRVHRHGPGRHVRGVFRTHRVPRHARLRAAELDAIPDIVASAVSSAMQSGFGPHSASKTSFPGKHSLFIKSVSGDVAVRGWDEDRIALEETGSMTRVREREDQVMVRAISGDIETRVPRQARVELTSVSGDVGVSGVRGKLGIRSVSGDVELEDLDGELNVDIVSGDLSMLRVSGKFSVDSHSGEVELEPVGRFSGQVTSKSGDIELRLSHDADVVLDMECEEDGDLSIGLDLPYEKLEEGENRLKLKLGDGTQTLVLRTRKADIDVKQAGGAKSGEGE